MRLLKLSVLLLVLVPGLCFCDEPASQGDTSSNSGNENISHDKQQTLRGEALNWIQVGDEQLKRGLYEQAEQSFLTAGQYKEYLTAAENKNLESRIARVSSAAAERKFVSENIQQAKDLIDKGQPVKARAAYEKIRNNPWLTDDERNQIASELRKIDSSFDKQRKEITDLYNRSVELYRSGNIEKAREGFAEVAKSDLLVTPKGQSPQDYLLQIDSILTAQMKSETTEKPATIQLSPADKKESVQAAASDSNAGSANDLDLLKTPQTAKEKVRQNQDTQEEIDDNDADSDVEPAAVVEQPQSLQDKTKAREKIIRTYTKAAVENAENRVHAYMGEGEFDKAVTVIHNTASVVRENRSIIGDELFVQYSARLKQLTEEIIEAGKKH